MFLSVAEMWVISRFNIGSELQIKNLKEDALSNTSNVFSSFTIMFCETVNTPTKSFNNNIFFKPFNYTIANACSMCYTKRMFEGGVRMQAGDVVYIILNNQKVEKVKIIKICNDSCLISMGEYSGFWIWKSRLFETEEEAKKSITKKIDIRYVAPANGL